MIKYILTYLGGIGTGTALLLIHQRIVKRAVNAEITKARGRFNALSDENDRLRGQINALTRDRADSKGYQRGVEDGFNRGRNMVPFERLESTLSNDGKRKVTVGGVK